MSDLGKLVITIQSTDLLAYGTLFFARLNCETTTRSFSSTAYRLREQAAPALYFDSAVRVYYPVGHIRLGSFNGVANAIA